MPSKAAEWNHRTVDDLAQLYRRQLFVDRWQTKGYRWYVSLGRLLIGTALLLLRHFQDAMQACQLQDAPSQRRGIDQTKHAAGAFSRIA